MNKKNLENINYLINIRNYMVIATSLYTISKQDINQINESLSNLDKKIVSELNSEEFKNFISE